VRAQVEGDVAPHREAEDLATYLTLCMAGLRTLLKTGADREVVGRSVGLFLDTLR
jgi:TetR/AcrR family transcriptional repressor of nem operon